MIVALVNCNDVVVQLEQHAGDLKLVKEALSKLDIEAEIVPWDDATVSWSKYDAVAICHTWDYVDKYDQFSSWLKLVSSESMLINPLSILQWNSDKVYLKEFEEYGIPIIPTYWLTASAFQSSCTLDIASIKSTKGWESGIVVKPSVGAGGHDIICVNEEHASPAVIEHITRMFHEGQSTLMIQPFLPCIQSVGELSVIYIDGRYSHAIRKIPAVNEFRVQEDYGGKNTVVEVDTEVVVLCDQVLSALARVSTRMNCDEVLYARIDLIPRDHGEGYYVCEVELLEPSLFFTPVQIHRDSVSAASGVVYSGVTGPMMYADGLKKRLELKNNNKCNVSINHTLMALPMKSEVAVSLTTPLDVCMFWFGVSYMDKNNHSKDISNLNNVDYMKTRMSIWFGGADPQFDLIQKQSVSLLHAVAMMMNDNSSLSIDEGFSLSPEWLVFSPLTCMAIVILCDQFPRCMYRGTGNAFSYDDLAVKVIKHMQQDRWLELASSEYSDIELLFIVIALQHSEVMTVQEEGFRLAHQLLLTDFGGADFADVGISNKTQRVIFFRGLKGFPNEHYEVLKRFGRFPSRNNALNRSTTIEEQLWLDSDECPAWAKSQQAKSSNK